MKTHFKLITIRFEYRTAYEKVKMQDNKSAKERNYAAFYSLSPPFTLNDFQFNEMD